MASNLRPFSEYSKEELREVSRRGGIASGVSRQERRKLKEELTALLAEGNTQERLCLALIEKASSGDSRAFQIIRDTVGEGVTGKLDVGLHGAEDALDALREDCRLEIEHFYDDELRRESPLYGTLAFRLADLETGQRLRRRYNDEIMATAREELRG